MKKSILNIEGKIERLVYKPGALMSQIKIGNHLFEEFNINDANATGIVTFGEKIVLHIQNGLPQKEPDLIHSREYMTLIILVEKL